MQPKSWQFPLAIVHFYKGYTEKQWVPPCLIWQIFTPDILPDATSRIKLRSSAFFWQLHQTSTLKVTKRGVQNESRALNIFYLQHDVQKCH